MSGVNFNVFLRHTKRLYIVFSLPVPCFFDNVIKLMILKKSADQDQTASTLFAIPSASFGCINAMLHQTFLF